jgi:hypothetical protein
MRDSPELRDTLLRLYDAMSSGDAGAVESFYSLDELAVFVSTDAAEFWADSARHNADVRPYFDGSRGTNRWVAEAPGARTQAPPRRCMMAPSAREYRHRDIQPPPHVPHHRA